MRKIEMLDLRAQYDEIKEEIDGAINQVLLSSRFIKGPEVGTFEKELSDYLGNKQVISCGNGTDALQLALMALDLKPGDEVITTDFTFIASAEVVALLGLKLVLVDVDPNTYNISVEGIRKAITSKTKAIIPVHLLGQCANMEEIMAIAKEHNLYVVEDSAQATGADFMFSNGEKKKAGTIGNIGATSFFPSKNLSCYGDGGAVMTNDDSIAERIRCIANHGSKIKYHNDLVGVNSRLDTIQASILSVKLKYLDDNNAARQRAAAKYDTALGEMKEISIPAKASFTTHIYHQYTIRVKDGKRDDLQKFLKSKEIPTMIYYPFPMHAQKAYSHLGYTDSDMPISTQLCAEVLALPIHPWIEEEQQNLIINSIKDFFAK
ncbi:MAG: DegT/DnrJ/EryC1/StrS family aminotransferase [Bacteroidales bacterium]|nr:DegT/DnrJ/EryC1/StrS family aminotransferase [Bacteroidales bacterium]